MGEGREEQPRLVAADQVDAGLSAEDVLAAMLGVPHPAMVQQVQSVLEYALIQEVYDGSPISADDEVLTLDFRHVFSRRDVAQLLQRLRGEIMF
jgi:hypothetical protein